MTTLTPPLPSEATAPSRHPLAPLFDVGTVRARSAQVLRSVERDLSASFKVDEEALSILARRVAALIAAADPAAAASSPPWSAPLWRHLQAGGIDRRAELEGLLAGQPAEERARAWLDLAVLGVLLGADPGPRWRCSEQSALPAAAFGQSTPDELLAMLDRAGKTAPGLAAARHLGAPAAAGSVDAPAAAGSVDAPATAGAVDAPAAAGSVDTPAAAGSVEAPVAAGSVDQAAAGSVDAQSAAGSVVEPAAAGAEPSAAISANAARPPSPPASPEATYGGPEGLAVAAFRAFVAGAFSADKGHPCRVDAGTLRHIDVAAVRAILQGTPQNPVQGLEGRATVLSRLGQLLQSLPGAGGASARPCDLVQKLSAAAAVGNEVQTARLLSELLRTLAQVWPAAPVQGLPGGDIWLHRWAGEEVGVGSAADAAEPGSSSSSSSSSSPGSNPSAAPKDLGTGGWMPLHAMGQALVGALALPLQHSGQTLAGLHELSAIADQPTSALLLAAGVVVPRQPRLLSRSLKLGDEAVIECRALTVALFDELTRRVHAHLQQRRGAPVADLPGIHLRGADLPGVDLRAVDLRGVDLRAVDLPGVDLPVAQVVHATATLLAGGGAPTLRIEGDGALF